MSTALAFVCANFPEAGLTEDQKKSLGPCLKSARASLKARRYCKALGTVVMCFGRAAAGNPLLERNHEHAVQDLRELELDTHRGDIRAAIENQDVYEAYQASNRLLLALGARTSNTTEADVELMTSARAAFQGHRYAVDEIVIKTLQVFLQWKSEKPTSLSLVG